MAVASPTTVSYGLSYQLIMSDGIVCCWYKLDPSVEVTTVPKVCNSQQCIIAIIVQLWDIKVRTDKTLKLLKSEAYWVNMAEDVEN